MPKVSANELRVGNVVEHDNAIWMLIKREHVKPGKGGAFIQAELKNIKTGSKLNERFRSEDTIEVLMTESLPYNLLYKIENTAIFMNEDGDQIEIDKEMIEDAWIFIKDGDHVRLNFIDGIASGVTISETIVLKVIETQAYIRGQTVTGTFKHALLENGITVQVPQFISEGEYIIIKTEDRSYVSKA